jgi:hypothetical protein
MIRNTTNHSSHPPRLRVDLNLGTLEALPDWSAAPRGSDDQILAAIANAGYQGIQAGPDRVDAARKHGLAVTAGARVDKPAEADPLARRMKEAGVDACTLHVGSGFEADAEADALLAAIIDASTRHDFPLYVETHRATLTQDCWRTLQFTQRHPDIRFNGDFSHWYTGLEMVYGGFDRKMALLQPVFDRVRFVHGRIGNPGSMQVDVGDGSTDGRPFVGHFRQMWTASFAGFLKTARPGDYLCFAPELLPARNFYSRTFAGREECDRWQQALILAKIARECFAEAASASPSSGHRDETSTRRSG